MPLPIIGNWIEGLKDAWKQAKLEHELSKSPMHNRATRFDDIRRERRKVRTDTRLEKERLGRRDAGERLRRAAITGTSRRGRVQGARDTVPNIADSSILDASFLRSIDQKCKGPTKTPMGPPDVRSAERRPSMLEPDRDISRDESENHKVTSTQLEATLEQANLKRSHSSVVSISDINEEYIMQVQRRVRQLETELEIARSRLSVYEKADRTTQCRPDDLTRPAATISIPAHGSASLRDELQTSDTPSVPEDETRVFETTPSQPYTNEESTSSIASDSVQQAEAVIESRTPYRNKQSARFEKPDSDAFCLSPIPIEFSPVRVELADVSNGEIARKEALHALKECPKRPA